MCLSCFTISFQPAECKRNLFWSFINFPYTWINGLIAFKGIFIPNWVNTNWNKKPLYRPHAIPLRAFCCSVLKHVILNLLMSESSLWSDRRIIIFIVYKQTMNNKLVYLLCESRTHHTYTHMTRHLNTKHLSLIYGRIKNEFIYCSDFSNLGFWPGTAPERPYA